MTPAQRDALVADEKRRRLALAVARVEAGRQEVVALKRIVDQVNLRLDAMLEMLTYDLRLLDEAIKLIDDVPTQRIPR